MQRVHEKYSYVSHHDKLPLEIDGKSKKRMQPLKKEQFNGQKATINQQSRSMLIRKLSSNTHDLNDLRSVIPTDDPRKKNRPASIKTFNENKENIKSGIDYLMQRTQSMKDSTHKEKAHIGEYHPPSFKRPQKKHFQSINLQSSEQQETIRSNHKKTSEIKLVNDLYSNVYREEKESLPSKRVKAANLFKCSQDLGFQKKTEKKMSENKLVQMFGSECMRGQKGPLRERRQDWRTSNINFF